MSSISPASADLSISLLEQTARFAEWRQTVLAGNIANINTPNYKTRDLPIGDFRKAVEDAIARRDAAGTSMDPTRAPQSDEVAFQPELFKAADVGRDHLTFQDGGNRNLEQETTEMTKNAITHRMAVELLGVRMRLLESVITGRL